MKKKLILVATAAALSLDGIGAVGMASADTDKDGTTSIVDKLVKKFGLKEAEVRAVFDEQRNERQAEHLEKVSEKLATGVKDGNITQEQSDKILAKVKELQAKYEANRDKVKLMTVEERKAAMETERTELKKWVSDNNIPDEFARLLHGGGRRHGGPGIRGGKGL